jgi:2-polyprenyl-6-methoxyphenol hydroxylase-like FAD-dependent oxidoreductase
MILLAHMPDVLERLRAGGVREIGLAAMAPPEMTFDPRPDDEDVVLLACRRATFEWALRESVRAIPTVELREGVTVSGLVGEANGGRPTVTGVRLLDGSILPASIVVDTSGRRSHAPEWLAALGAPRVRERSSETGIFYYTRFYRLTRRDRLPTGTTGLVAGDFGWVKLAIFPGDADTFSITVGAPVTDGALKGLTDPARFERFLGAFAGIAPWRARGVSRPIAGAETPVLAMGQLRNRLRRFVDREGPLAAGFFAIGDAAYHTNPMYGRGCAMALVQAALLDEALGCHRHDLRAAAIHLDRESERQLRPYWDAAVAGDRRAAGADASPPALTNPVAVVASVAEQAFGWFLERGILPASRVDPVVFRGLLRAFHMLEHPERAILDPDLLVRSLPVLGRVLRGDGPPPPFPHVRRATVLARLDETG